MIQILIFTLPTIVGIVVGGGLTLVFCGMTIVFMAFKRKNGGKDKSNTSNAEMNKKMPKTGISSTKDYR